MWTSYRSDSRIISFEMNYHCLGAVLENLSAGRMGICQESINRLGSAIVIAVRYAAVRKQFSNAQKEETPIIEYEIHVRKFM